VHLTKTVMEHLRAIRTERKYVFPWPSPFNGQSPRHVQDSFFRHFRKLQRIAGITGKDHFGLHTIRKTLATRLWEISPGAAQCALGHTAQDVTKFHYVDGTAMVARALDALPQPAAFQPNTPHFPQVELGGGI
jgi:integrase